MAAAWRTAAKQAVKAARIPIVTMLKKGGLPPSQAAMFSKFLETERGASALALVLGFAVMAVPNIGAREKVARLGRELRVNWAFRIPGERWAVAFVWRTFHRGFAYCAVSGPDHYSASLTAAKVGARRACWARLGETEPRT